VKSRARPLSSGALLASVLLILASATVFAQYTQDELDLISEHLYMGLPQTYSGTQQILVRTAYVNCYDSSRRVGLWSAYYVEPDYLCTPERESRFETYREDTNASGCPIPDEYARQYQPGAQKYDAGHLSPYNIAGGDRDEDGLYACYRPSNPDEDEGCICGDLSEAEWLASGGDCDSYCGPSDLDDEQTVFEINYLSNFAPQHESFNRWGLWRTLERQIQETWVEDQGLELWVIAGSIFTSAEPAKAGPQEDIHIPQLFFKLVVKVENDEPVILAFLFPHEADSSGEIEDYLVTVDTIEALSGFDFFRDLPDTLEAALESQGTWENWSGFGDR